MKKIIFVILSIFLPNVILAQESIENLEINESNSIEEDVILNDSSMENEIIDGENINLIEDVIENESLDTTLNELGDDNGLGNIHFGFCYDGIDNISDTLNIAIEQGKINNVCMVFYNDANQDVILNMDYTKMGSDQYGLESCSTNTSFEKYIENIDQIKKLIIPAGESVQVDMKLFFPIGIEGDQGACVTFSTEDNNNDEGSSSDGAFTIKTIFKRGYPMHFFVGGIEDVKNDIKINNIETSLNGNKELILKFNVENVGNIENSLEIFGDISNILGYKRDFIVEGGKVLPGKSLPIEVNIGTIASYGGLFNIDINVNSTPFFSYDISNSSIDPTLLESKEFTASTTFFQMPWLILIIVIIVILLIITIFRKPKEKVVYVQNPQQPMPNPGYQQPQYTQPQQPQYQDPQVQQPVQPQQPQYPNNPQYGQPMQQNPQPTPPQYNPNN